MKCSVIVPVYEHWHLIPELLDCLRAQSYPAENFEVLLVDNDSKNFDPPDDLPANTTIHVCSTAGSYSARNHGIAQAQGEWLVFTDADCRPRRDWMQTLMACAEQLEHPTVLAGAIQMVPQNDPPNRYEIYDLVRGIPQAWYVRRGYAATANLAAPASLARSLECFDSTRYSGADADFCRRAVKHGASLHFVGEALVEHPARCTWNQLVTKVRRVKAGQLAARSRRERLIWRLRSFLPPVIAIGRFISDSAWPLSYRVIAIGMHVCLWPIEIRQALRSNAIR